MPDFGNVINSFNGGELSPFMYGRSDIDKYDSGAETILNWIVRPEGGLVRRSATRFVKEAADSTKQIRLLPFVFSTEQAYVIEMGEYYFRFYKNEGLILETAVNITDITRANPAVVTSAGHGYSNDDVVYISGVGGMTDLNGRYFTVANKTANTFELSGEDSSFYDLYTSGGTAARVYTIAHTYTEDEIQEINFAQSADILFIVHPDHAPAQLSRTAHTSWTLTDIDFQDGPYLVENITDTTLNPSGITGAINIVASATTGINDDTGFQATDIGRCIRFKYGTLISSNIQYRWGWCKITAVTDTTHVDATIYGEDFDGATATKKWRLGEWYIGNYPSAVSFAEGRLWFAASPDYPQTVNGSKSADFYTFSPTNQDRPFTISDDNAVSYTIGANRVNKILWLDVVRNLIMGTPGGMFPLQSGSANDPVTPTQVNVPHASVIGTAAVKPVVVGSRLVYADRASRKIRGLRYTFEEDNFISDDLTRLASHITSSGISYMDFALNPSSTVWCVRSDGKIATLTLVAEEDVFAWSLQKVGGSFGAGDAVVENIAIIPSPNEDHDQIWCVVKRTIDGSTVRYIEFFEEDFDGDLNDIEDAFFVDCGLTYDGSAATTISGLDHLEGETVQVLADGSPVSDKTVTNGQITLDSAASVVHVGIGFESDLQTLRLVVPTQTGSSQGFLARPTHAMVMFKDTIGGKYGPDSSLLDPIEHRDALDAMDEPVPLYNGYSKLEIEHDSSRDPRIFIRQDQPVPTTVCSMTVLGEVERK